MAFATRSRIASIGSTVFAQQELKNDQRIQQKLRQRAQKHGFQLVPITPE
jgi:hypothetical protein